MKKILLIQGPNMNYLGIRQPEIYGTTSATELDALLMQHAATHHYELSIFYTPIEGEAIHCIYKHIQSGTMGLVMNPAAFCRAGYALQDCIQSIAIPYIEIHISNIAKRGRDSILAEVASGVIYGFGIDGYLIALNAMLSLLNTA